MFRFSFYRNLYPTISGLQNSVLLLDHACFLYLVWNNRHLFSRGSHPTKHLYCLQNIFWLLWHLFRRQEALKFSFSNLFRRLLLDFSTHLWVKQVFSCANWFHHKWYPCASVFGLPNYRLSPVSLKSFCRFQNADKSSWFCWWHANFAWNLRWCFPTRFVHLVWKNPMA